MFILSINWIEFTCIFLQVVGESGLGKTTFLNALLRRYHENIIIASPEVSITEKTLQIQKVGEIEVKTETGDGVVRHTLYYYRYYSLYTNLYIFYRILIYMIVQDLAIL